MNPFEMLFVPMVLFMVIVAPIVDRHALPQRESIQ